MNSKEIDFNWHRACQKKWIEPKQLGAWSLEMRRQYKRIVTINGSFDLMHAGHLHMLYEASKQGDVLMVALNTDASIQQYKSLNRPIIPLQYRLQMMAAIEFVDYLTWFDETNPCHVLSLIAPHVHVNGSEYGQNCIEADVVKQKGGRVHIVDLIDGLSTSAILQKIIVTQTPLQN